MEAARAEFRCWLFDRRLLIVIDDVWDGKDAQPHLDVPGCCRLLTTRLSATFPQDAILVPLARPNPTALDTGLTRLALARSRAYPQLDPAVIAEPAKVAPFVTQVPSSEQQNQAVPA